MLLLTGRLETSLLTCTGIVLIVILHNLEQCAYETRVFDVEVSLDGVIIERSMWHLYHVLIGELNEQMACKTETSNGSRDTPMPSSEFACQKPLMQNVLM